MKVGGLGLYWMGECGSNGRPDGNVGDGSSKMVWLSGWVSKSRRCSCRDEMGGLRDRSWCPRDEFGPDDLSMVIVFAVGS